MTLPICEKLRAFDRGMPDFIGGPGECNTVTMRNPDGPEAVDLIETLVEALDKCRAIIKFHVKNSGACCTLAGSDKPFSALEAFDGAVSALAKARGETAIWAKGDDHEH